MSLSHKVGLDDEQLRILFSSFGSVSGVGLLSYAALPFLIGATMESLDLNAAEVGFLYTLEFLAAATSSLILAPRTGGINRRNLAFAGASIAIVGSLASAWWCSYEALLVIRPFTGAGAGLTLAAGNATIANARHPAKIAGLMNVLFAALVLVLMLLLPVLAKSWGVIGVFLGLAAAMFIFLALLLLMPQRVNVIGPVSEAGQSDNTVLISVSAIAVFAAFFLFTMRDSMAWGFAERIGTEVGYSSAQVGGLLSVQALIGLLGPALAALIGFRYGVKLPLLLGLTVAGLTTYAIFLSVDIPGLFEIPVLCWTAGYFFGISYLTAFAASLDSEGRIAAASGSALVLGVAVGPAFAGYLITYGGYDLGAWAQLAMTVASIIAVVISLKWAHDTWVPG
ncbi:MAG: MFS transporter [Halieaceae bacterium]|nr:MFS transporter [Halieaceae bacterium]